jgi:hypothetical protein
MFLFLSQMLTSHIQRLYRQGFDFLFGILNPTSITHRNPHQV